MISIIFLLNQTVGFRNLTQKCINLCKITQNAVGVEGRGGCTKIHF